MAVERDTESLVSTERLSCDSPVMWPDHNFCERLEHSLCLYKLAYMYPVHTDTVGGI